MKNNYHKNVSLEGKFITQLSPESHINDTIVLKAVNL